MGRSGESAALRSKRLAVNCCNNTSGKEKRNKLSCIIQLRAHEDRWQHFAPWFHAEMRSPGKDEANGTVYFLCAFRCLCNCSKDTAFQFLTQLSCSAYASATLTGNRYSRLEDACIYFPGLFFCAAARTRRRHLRNSKRLISAAQVLVSRLCCWRFCCWWGKFNAVFTPTTNT